MNNSIFSSLDALVAGINKERKLFSLVVSSEDSTADEIRERATVLSNIAVRAFSRLSLNLMF